MPLRRLRTCLLTIIYIAVSTADPGTIDNKNASTILQILSSTGRYALLHLQPLTGRKHQLRLVCSEILQAPVIGDYKYGYTGKQVEGHLLHCFDLQFQVSFSLFANKSCENELNVIVVVEGRHGKRMER